MGDIALQRFEDLIVNEVSIVDSPANECNFLVAKRRQKGEDMPAEKKGSEPEVVATDVAVDDSAKVAIEKCNNLVDSLVEKVRASAEQKLAETELKVEKTTEEVETEKGSALSAANVAAPEKSKKTFRDFMRDKLKAAGVSEEDMTKTMSDFDKRFGDPKDTITSQPPLKSTTKSEETVADIENKSIDHDDAVAAHLETLAIIEKAKMMTPERVAKLMEVMESLQKLMLDVIAPNAFPNSTVGVMTNGPGYNNPNTTRAALAGNDRVPVKKEERVKDEVVELLKAIVEKTKGSDEMMQTLTDRLEKIEKRRGAPTPGDDETTSPTEKSTDGMWDSLGLI